MLLPVELSRAVERELAPFEAETLARAAAELSLVYRASRRGSAQPLLTAPAHRAAYAAVRLPATYAAINAVFHELTERLPGARFRSLLDLGAGPGTVGWAAAEFYPELERVTFVESDGEMLSLGRRLAGEAGHAALLSAEWQLRDLRRAHPFAPHDVVVAAYSLGELGAAARREVAAAAWSATGQVLVLIEPGTPRGFSHILDARAELIGRGAHLVAPCPHANRCPLAGEEDDWCHFAARVERSPLHRRLKEGSLSYEDEKFSYVAVAKTPVQLPRARVLRHPLKRAGHLRLDLCAADGRRRATLSQRDKEVWRRARKTRWGDAWED